MPLAVRLVGDATIVAAGLEMGWKSKRAPIWATRLSMRCGGVPPMTGELECRIVLTALAPSPKADVRYTATAYYRLGRGEVSGTAAVVIPESEAA